MQNGTDQKFTATRWSVVLVARDSRSPSAKEALEALCKAYWYPLYAFVRRQGYSPSDAEDLTQAFFAFILQSDALGGVGPEKGKFRSFLIASLKHFLSNERDRAKALKRGGGRQIISWDGLPPEERYKQEPADPMTAEKLFERRWALSVLDQARARLRKEVVAAGRTDLFDMLQAMETGKEALKTYAELAKDLGTTESAIKNAVPRMQKRYLELVRDEVAQTVGGRAETDEELRHLISVVSG